MLLLLVDPEPLKHHNTKCYDEITPSGMAVAKIEFSAAPAAAACSSYQSSVEGCTINLRSLCFGNKVK